MNKTCTICFEGKVVRKPVTNATRGGIVIAGFFVKVPDDPDIVYQVECDGELAGKVCARLKRGVPVSIKGHMDNSRLILPNTDTIKYNKVVVYIDQIEYI